MSKLILEENESKNYKPRTEVNAMLADLTIAIALKHDTAGERVTKEFVAKHNKKYIAVRPEGNIEEKAERIVDKINEFNLPQYICLNVAGNGLYTIAGEMNQQQLDDFVYKLLKLIIENTKLKSKIRTIRSGGQTGADESGAKAGLKLGLPTTVYMPKGFLIRTQDGRDITMSAEHARQRFDIREPTVSLVKRKKIMIDMDGTLCSFIGSYEKWKREHPEITYPQSQFGFFSNLEPIPNAIEAYNELKKHFDIYILTKPSTYNLMCYTEKADWVKRHLGFQELENLIICCDKSLVKGDYLIDDDTRAGQLEFSGEHIHFWTEKFPDWVSVLKYLGVKL